MEELEAGMADIIADFRKEAMDEYRYAMQREGIKMTGELLDSFESTLRQDAINFIFECQVKFGEYGRYKDMKGLNVGDKMAPLEAMEYFVEKTGVQKFMNGIWAERYGKIRSQSKLIRDIAWGVRIARYRQIEHRRKGRGWYAKTTGKLYGMTGERVRQAAALAALRYIKTALQGND